MAKKREEIVFCCPECGWVNEPIKEQSDENWKVVNAKCDKCGTDNTIRIK